MFIVACVTAATGVRGILESAYRGCGMACVAASAILETWLQPADRGVS